MAHRARTAYRQITESAELSTADTRIGMRFGAPPKGRSKPRLIAERVVLLPDAVEFFARRGGAIQLKDEIGSCGPGTLQVRVLPQPGQTIDGMEGIALVVPRIVLVVYSDGDNWQVVQCGAP